MRSLLLALLLLKIRSAQPRDHEEVLERSDFGAANPSIVNFHLNLQPIMEKDLTTDHVKFQMDNKVTLACLNKKSEYLDVNKIQESLKIILSPFLYLPCMKFKYSSENYHVCFNKHILFNK